MIFNRLERRLDKGLRNEVVQNFGLVLDLD